MRCFWVRVFAWSVPLIWPLLLSAQNEESGGNDRRFGTVTGSFQMDGQYYITDSAIGTPEVPEDILFNGFGQVNYRLGGFQAGMRFEAFQNPLLGISPQYQGQGIANRYVMYGTDHFDITAGNFYEQFGSGIALRSYWEPLLGIDNAFDGFRVRGRILKGGLILKTLIGRQRYYWGVGPGIVRAADAEFDVNALLDTLMPQLITLRFGGSAVSRYLPDNDPSLRLPTNVASFAGRFNLGIGDFNLQGEYVHKVNDPAQYNVLYNSLLHYNPGQAIYASASYSRESFGLNLEAKRLENMDFRSARNADFVFNELPISFLPPLAKQHTWRLQTLYLYATQPNGEVGLQADAFVNLKRGSKLGGKYGTTIHINYSRVYGIKRDTTGLVANLEYAGSSLFSTDAPLFYEDFNAEITRKFSTKFKATLAYVYMRNRLSLQGLGTGVATTHLAVFEGQYKLNRKHTLRWELQHLYIPSDRGITSQKGSWAMAMLEYTFAPHWFFTVSDEFNYGNEVEEDRQHYYAAIAGYTWGSHRVSFGYARQRRGIICVGGICRVVPASNGVQVSLSTTF
jgi:hypothetical protein